MTYIPEPVKPLPGQLGLVDNEWGEKIKEDVVPLTPEESHRLKVLEATLKIQGYILTIALQFGLTWNETWVITAAALEDVMKNQGVNVG